MRFLSRMAISLAMLSCSGASFCVGQTDNLSPVEMAKTFPPRIQSAKQNDFHRVVIDWQLKQKRISVEDCRAGRDELAAKIDSAHEKIAALNKELPGEIHRLDESIRSQLVGKAMGELLMAKLELATMVLSVC